MVQTQLSGKRLGYIPALDGLRAISILLVVGSHAGLDHVLPGAFGVTLFFFISGYLITRQLCESLAGEGRLRLGAFYVRRMLRLMPAALSYILLAGCAFSLAGGHITPAGWVTALFYGANYYDIWIGYKTSWQGVRHPFNILWSLAIEEHFYALWPALLGVLWRKRLAIAGLAAVCVAVLCWRVWLYEACFCHAPWLGSGAWGLCGRLPANTQWRYNRLYMATDTRLDSIAYGAILAVSQASGMRLPKLALPAAAILLVSVLLPGSFARQVVRTSLQGAALLYIFPLLLESRGRLAQALSAPPAVAIGPAELLALSLALGRVWRRRPARAGARHSVAGDRPAACRRLVAALIPVHRTPDARVATAGRLARPAHAASSHTAGETPACNRVNVASPTFWDHPSTRCSCSPGATRTPSRWCACTG